MAGAAYAFWTGPAPAPERWTTAVMVGGGAALVQLLLVFRRPAPVNRRLLGANLYLLVGGLAAVARPWWLLVICGELKESGIRARARRADPTEPTPAAART